MVELCSSVDRRAQLRRSHALAVGLSRKCGHRILLVIDDNRSIFNPYKREIIPYIEWVFSVADPGTLLSVDGEEFFSAVEDRYLRANAPDARFRLVEVADEPALAQFVSESWDYVLSPLREEDIEITLIEYEATHPILANPDSR